MSVGFSIKYSSILLLGRLNELGVSSPVEKGVLNGKIDELGDTGAVAFGVVNAEFISERAKFDVKSKSSSSSSSNGNEKFMIEVVSRSDSSDV